MSKDVWIGHRRAEDHELDEAKQAEILSQFRDQLSLAWEMYLAKLTSDDMSRTVAAELLSREMDEF